MLRHARTYVERDVLSKVVINGVDRDAFGFIEKESARRQLGLDIQRPIVLSVGSVIKRKGFDVLIEALMLLKSQNAEDEFPILYILGAEGPEGDYRKALQNKVTLLDLVDDVIFFGGVDNANLKLWYNAADVFCLASRGEGSPNVLTEALACGVPSVATNVGAVNDIACLTGANVLVVPKEGASEMATMLNEQLNTGSNRHANSKTFLRHDWDWCARSVMEILDNLG
jgi:glycosyltransferase involved in cell wall biosynthesis